MIHEIAPKEYKVAYQNCTQTQSDTILLFDSDRVCCRLDGEEVAFPKIGDFADLEGMDLYYLFSIDDERFFMPHAHGILPPNGYEWHDSNICRTSKPRHLAFAIVTARALHQWYNSNKYCGSCGADMGHSETERACVCTKCGLIVYPKICPVIIAAVTHGDSLLVTRGKGWAQGRYALVAGFVESGESLEDAVRREVFEETGVHAKNITYYKSQPWGFTSTLLSGFYCELDGDPAIHIDENELSEAVWLSRDEIPPATADIALTAEMMEVFKYDL